MKDFLQKMRNMGFLMGTYVTHERLVLGEGKINLIYFIATSCTGFIEIDGKDIEIVFSNCFKIDYEEVEIYLTPSETKEKTGSFHASLPGETSISRVSPESKAWAKNVLRGLS